MLEVGEEGWLLCLATEESEILIIDLHRGELVDRRLLDIGISCLAGLGRGLLGVGLENDCGMVLNLAEDLYCLFSGPKSYITSMCKFGEELVFSSFDGSVQCVGLLEAEWRVCLARDTLAVSRQAGRPAALLKDRLMREGQGVSELQVEDQMVLAMGTDCSLAMMLFQDQK